MTKSIENCHLLWWTLQRAWDPIKWAKQTSAHCSTLANENSLSSIHSVQMHSQTKSIGSKVHESKFRCGRQQERAHPAISSPRSTIILSNICECSLSLGVFFMRLGPNEKILILRTFLSRTALTNANDNALYSHELPLSLDLRWPAANPINFDEIESRRGAQLTHTASWNIHRRAPLRTHTYAPNVIEATAEHQCNRVCVRTRGK